MLNDLRKEYAEQSDDGLLQLASDRASLTDEAAVALDSELSRRNLTKSDQAEHERFASRMERRQFRTRRRKIFGKSQLSWRELLSYFAAIGVIFFVYFALPSRYHLKPDWQEAAVCTVLASVMIVVGWRSLWRDTGYWTALIVSSSAQLVIVHVWTRRVGELSRVAGKAATLLGFVFFLAMYGCIRLFRRKFDAEASSAGG